MAPSVSCPGCRASLQPIGTLQYGDRTLTVYQCDHCTRPWNLSGEVFPAALTFALDEDGNAFNPDTLEPMRFDHPYDN